MPGGGDAMRDAVVMWREPRLVVLTAVCAAMYVAAMLPFKFMTIIPGLAEVRPAAALPVVFSLLFGPAGAWGAGFGNVIGDLLGGMLGLGSIFGFAGNFLYGYLPYKLWQAFFKDKRVVSELDRWQTQMSAGIRIARLTALVLAGIMLLAAAELVLHQYTPAAEGQAKFNIVDYLKFYWPSGQALTAGQTLALVCGPVAIVAGLIIGLLSPVRLVAVILISSMACAATVGWGVDMIGQAPYRLLGSWILMNNFGVCLALVPALIPILYRMVAKRYLLFSDLLPQDGQSASTPSSAASQPASSGLPSSLGGILVTLAVLALFFTCLIIGPDQASALLGVHNSFTRGLAFSPLVVLLFLSLFAL
jgi:hypothetical protein